MIDRPYIVSLVSNLMFATRIEAVAQAQQVAVVSPPDRLSFLDALAQGARLALIDASLPDGAWFDWVADAKANPASTHVPVIAFGSHVDVALRERALAAGVDRYLARSNFVEGLPDLIALAVRQTNDDPCAEALPASAVRGIEEFNAGQYFEQHETLELLWRAERRPVRDLYRGILQIGVACYQIERGNGRGALKMLDRAVRWLQPFRPACQGVDVDRLLADAARLRNEIERVGLNQVERIPHHLFPTVNKVADK